LQSSSVQPRLKAHGGRAKMKLTNDNLEKIVDYIESQLADKDAGEFDEETPILSAVERTVEMFEENENVR
jgi:predicted transcriptional regulator